MVMVFHLNKMKNNSAPENIAYTGCFGDYNVTSCVRDSVLSSFAIITAFICAIKLHHLIRNQHSLPNQYIIFIFGLVESILCAINWIYLWEYPVVYVIEFLKIIQCVVVCRFYCALAAQIYRMDNLAKRFVPLFAAAFLLVVFGICVSGWATRKNNHVDCIAVQWILLSFAELVNAQFFLVAGIFVTKKLNDVRTLEDMRNSKKRELWGSIVVFEISAIASIIHDAIFKALGPDNGCHGILSTSASGYTAVYIAFKVTRWLLPIWGMAALFAIEDNSVSHESLAFLAARTPSGFRPRFYPSEEQNAFDQSGESTANDGQSKRLLLPPFLRTARKYGSINRPATPVVNSGQFDENPAS
ncbi:uncharacterized protein LOC114530945 [Dendronephthya gigantea]|uniref:uncharacterized protein LOC114530945 n=1 Tax=Dendronephthya gigantea TaxID=151771 RepID=UPI00106BFA1D|nr:uncharacterized protein LOC114530945 [Dendronephthya gigantea]